VESLTENFKSAREELERKDQQLRARDVKFQEVTRDEKEGIEG
jgi:hypothetical protein